MPPDWFEISQWGIVVMRSHSGVSLLLGHALVALKGAVVETEVKFHMDIDPDMSPTEQSFITFFT